jgi:hypothetical protein
MRDKHPINPRNGKLLPVRGKLAGELAGGAGVVAEVSCRVCA